MGTKQYDSATDLITLTRASGGTALRKISYGSELVTNGTFDSDTTGWLPNAYGLLSVDTQRLKVETGNPGSWNYAYQQVTVTIGQTYRFQASSTAGTATAHRINLGTGPTNGHIVISTGYVDTTFIATTNIVYVALQNTDGVLGSYTFFDNISIKEVLFDQPNGTLQLFNHGNNIPRIEYNADGTVKGLLIEEARTNLLPTSNNFSNWSVVRASATTSTEISPSGSTDAFIVKPTVSPGITWVYYNPFINTGVVTTISTFAKASGKSFLTMSDTHGTSRYASFNLTTGTVGTVVSGYTANMEDFGNGWYRCSVTTPTGFNERAVFAVSDTDGGISSAVNGDDGILLYGAQVEAGSFPTSYIPTSGATATRAADFASIPVDNFGYNNDAGSLVLDVQTPLVSQVMLLAYFNTSTYINSRGFVKGTYSGNGAGNWFKNDTYDGGSTRLHLPSPLANSTSTKLGLSYKDNENEIGVRDGGTVISGTGRSPNPTTLHMAGRENGYQSQCWIKSVKYYPRKLTDTQLQELTT